MKIFLYLRDRIVEYVLPNEIMGSFSFDPMEEENKLINVEVRDGRWVIYSTSHVNLLNKDEKVDYLYLEPDKYYTLQKNEIKYLVYAKNILMEGMLSFKYNNNMNISVGNSNDNSIIYNCSYINNNICFDIKDNQIKLFTNGNRFIYINGFSNKNEEFVINYGDEVNILDFKIIFLKDFFIINNKKNIYINSNEIKNKVYNFPILDKENDEEIEDVDLYKKDDYFFKAPRIRRTIEKKEIELSTPPKSQLDKDIPFILVIGPMLTMGIISIVTITNTIIKLVTKQSTLANSWSSLITSGVMLISMLLWPLITRTYQKKIKEKKLKENISKYMKYLDDKKKVLGQEQTLQRSILNENLITINQCIDIIKNKSLTFWDKRLDQNDFLTLRLGVGDVPLNVDFKYSKEDFSLEDNEIRNKVESLIEEYKYLRYVPVSYSFYENKVTAIMGNKNKTIDFLNNLILQILTFNSYENVKIVFFTNDNNKKNWDYLKYVNHNFDDTKSFRFFASDNESAKSVAEYLEFEINYRKQQESQNKKVPRPYYLIITDDYDKIKRYDFADLITEEDKNIGFGMIILENRLGNLPSKCNNFINIGDKTSGILKNAYEKQEQLDFVDEIHKGIDMMELAKILANIPIEIENNFANLVNTISFLEMEKVGKVEQLNILNRWNNNIPIDSLKTEIGVDEFGDIIYLDLHEKSHGPHGLIAGMTGSGKSEFIITYILSMAINYSPEYVSFILIDYKGGGLTGAFENSVNGIVLPHLAGTITNLDKAEMNRTLVSIDSEIKRRQEIFNEVRNKLGESTIDIYKYQKFYQERKIDKPIPHLIIICDEFAELKSQQPEFMDNLISVARIGRSLGIHLVLSTQKPSGVVNDQIWSNSKFRVCLKVQDENDSREVLKKNDAAYLKQVGRFYLQVGFNEYYVLGQSAWCGEKYIPSDTIQKYVDKSINFINDYGQFIKSVEANKNNNRVTQGEQLATIIKSIVEVSKQLNITQNKLWLDNIPKVILEDDLEKKYNYEKEPYNVKAIIGEYDAPEIQKQGLVEYDFINDGNTIIYGINGIEKEMVLNEIIYSSTKNHSSQELNYYIVDYGSETLGRWIDLPHVGGVVYSNEVEEFTNLFKLIKQELNKRKKIFSQFGGDYKNYITQNKDLPLKVVIINNFDSVFESNNNIYDELPELVRDSVRYGIVFIITANAINSVSNKISQNFDNLYVLRLKDSNDYLSLFNTNIKLTIKDSLGRGLVKKEGLHEFQTARITFDDKDMNNFIHEFIINQKNSNIEKAKIIPLLPKVVTYNDIKDEITNIQSIPIGISKDKLKIINMNYFNNTGNIISSYKLENTRNFVLSMLEIFTKIKNINIFVIDPLSSLNLDKTIFKNYFTENLDKVLDSFITYIKKLIEDKQYIDGIVVVYGLNRFLTKLNGTSKFEEFVDLLNQYEKLGLIVIDEVARLKTYTYEVWFSQNFDLNEGLWIGTGITDQGMFRITNMNNNMNKPIKNDMGYIVKNGVGILCKLINFIKEEDEENEE